MPRFQIFEDDRQTIREAVEKRRHLDRLRDRQWTPSLVFVTEGEDGDRRWALLRTSTWAAARFIVGEDDRVDDAEILEGERARQALEQAGVEIPEPERAAPPEREGPSLVELMRRQEE